MSGREILFLAHRLPFPPDRGDRIRAHHLLKALARLAPVHVGCFVDSESDRAAEPDLAAMAASRCVVTRRKPLALAGVEALLSGQPVSLAAFYSARLQHWVQETLAARPIAAIVVFSGQMGQYVPDDFAGRVVIDLCDVDSAKFQTYADNGERRWLNRREARLLADVEERLGQRADATLLVSDAEAALYESRLHRPDAVRIEVLVNGVDASYFDPSQVSAHPAIKARSGPHFVFTGQMDYRPNEQAALWAITQFLPQVRHTHPQAQMHIVGRNPSPALMAHSGEAGVTVWGEVPDVRPFLTAADCVLVPLTLARGVQNKVLEAMAMARPVLLTPEAATGIAASDGEHWLVCRADAEGTVAEADSLLSDPDKSRAIGDAARQFVLSHHAWDAVMAPLADLVFPDEAGARHAA